MTQEELKRILHYDPNTGIFTRLSSKRSSLIGTQAGTFNHGYIQIRVGKKIYQAHRLAWLYIHGEWPDKVIDHKDGNPSNNCIDNLRVCTLIQNQFNSRKPVINTSGVKGVYFSKSTGKWQASIRVNGKLKYLGVFADFNDAVVARQNAATKYHGEFVNHG